MSQTRIHTAPSELQNDIERHFAAGADAKLDPDSIRCFKQLRDALERGEIRAAEPDGHGGWHTNEWVKRGILLGFRLGELVDFPGQALSFVDKDTFPARHMTSADRVRIITGGSAIRRGAYVAPGVICAPPMYINTGAYVDEGTLVDSHALVGSCAQIGKRVHISAAAQIGGVLEPIGKAPVVIEDDVMIGGNAGIYEGVVVRSRVVIASGVIINGSTPIYDTVRGQIYRREVPYGAVVIPGSRPMEGAFAEQHHLSIATPVIKKYRDAKTDAATELEEALR